MFTIGITKGRWNTLLTALQQFKDDYDTQPADVAHPAGVLRSSIPRYERMGLRDLCQHIHELYAKDDIARLTTEMYLSRPAAGDEAERRLRPHRAPQDRAGGDRRSWKAASRPRC